MSATLDDEFRRAAERQIGESDVDGWLLFDLEGRNRIAAEILGLPDGLSRRYFVLLRPGAPPVVLGHAIERQPWSDWPGDVKTYVGWEELDEELSELLSGCGRVAMEISERDDVPFVDYVPAGVRELVESRGVEVVSSAELISGSYAQWGERGYALHHQAGRALADVASRAYGRCMDSLASGAAVTERELADWVLGQVERAGLTGGDCIVAFGPNSANPHYHPVEGGDRTAARGEAFLLDLWARVREEPAAVFADQTWMGFLDDRAPEDFRDAWRAVRDARDATVSFISSRTREGDLPTGAEADRAARRVLEERGYGEHVLHRTGHGMDRVNHGFGPNLDSVETRDRRELVPGVGFSVEPGVYLPDRFGVRSEINVFMSDDGPEVTTPDVQTEPWTGD